MTKTGILTLIVPVFTFSQQTNGEKKTFLLCKKPKWQKQMQNPLSNQQKYSNRPENFVGKAMHVNITFPNFLRSQTEHKKTLSSLRNKAKTKEKN